MTKRLSLSELEEYISSINVSQYAEQRNYIGGSTELSEYITRGFISLPRVQSLILLHNTRQSSYKLLNELAWREYWQHTWRVRGDEIYDYFRPLQHQPRQGIPTAVLQAKTGIAALDDGIGTLYQTGYIHNHLRLWLAGLICNVAKCDWKIGAAWMHSLLIDGDFASNYLSWQWVAGSYTGSAYLPQQDNINTYTRTSQTNTYLDHSYEFINSMSIPAELSEITTQLPNLDVQSPKPTIKKEALHSADSLLLYSPWTLDPLWRSTEQAERVLIMPTNIFISGAFSQNVLDSISYFSNLIVGLKIIYLSPAEISSLANPTIHRKDYPGIQYWPGEVDPPELLYPQVLPKFYPSFSSYWKQVSKAYL